MKGKKGASVYVSWVLVTAVAFGLGFLMYNWTVGHVRQSSSELEARSQQSICRDVTLSVEQICQNTQNLYTNMTNTNVVKIDRLLVRITDLYGDSESRDEEVELAPGDKETNYRILKPGSVALSVRITPVVLEKGNSLICQESSVELEDIDQC